MLRDSLGTKLYQSGAYGGLDKMLYMLFYAAILGFVFY